MGCRHCFVVDLVEEIVGEGGSRSSSRVHEHDSFQLVSQQNVAIQAFWSLCQPRSTLSARDLHHGNNRFLRSVVSCFVFHIEVRAVTRKTCLGRSFLRANNRFHRSIMIWVWVWLAWLGTFCLSPNFIFWLSSNFWTQIFHPVMFQGNLWRRPRWRKNLLVFDFSGFHPNNFRDTISWECFVKIDSVRSSLIGIQSFLPSKVDVDPIHRIFGVSSMFCACIVQDAVLPNRSCQDPYVLFPWDPLAERILSVLLNICPSGINPELMMECKLIAHPTW